MLAAFDYGDGMALCILNEKGEIIFNCQSIDINYICVIVSFYKLRYFVTEEYILGEQDYRRQIEYIKSYLPKDTAIIEFPPSQWKYSTESKVTINTKHFIECTRFAKYAFRKLCR